MTTPSTFRERWLAATKTDLVPFSARAVTSAPIPEIASAFLLDPGLPHDCAVCHFYPDDDRTLATVLDVLGLEPDDVDDADMFARMESLLVIGGDGSGDKIVLDEQGRVHRVHVSGGFELQLVSTSVPAFAECLLSYEHHEIHRSDELVIAGRIEVLKERLQACVQSMRALDPSAYVAGAFWPGELANILIPFGFEPRIQPLALELAEIILPTKL